MGWSQTEHLLPGHQTGPMATSGISADTPGSYSLEHAQDHPSASPPHSTLNYDYIFCNYTLSENYVALIQPTASNTRFTNGYIAMQCVRISISMLLVYGVG